MKKFEVKFINDDKSMRIVHAANMVAAMACFMHCYGQHADVTAVEIQHD